MAVDTSRSLALTMVAPRTRGRRAALAAATALVIGTASGSLVLPAGLSVLAGVIGLALVVAARATARPVRSTLIARSARRARERRSRARERALARATLGGRETLAELVKLVDDIEATAPEIAQRLDLEDLLDRHVALAVAHERTVRAVSMVDRVQLERTRDAHRADPAIDKRRLELCERRLQTHAQCQARAELLANELALLADLIRLIAQRAACPDEPALDDRIERHLADLDEDEAARKQVAADIS
jgi:hypothetical protein